MCNKIAESVVQWSQKIRDLKNGLSRRPSSQTILLLLGIVLSLVVVVVFVVDGHYCASSRTARSLPAAVGIEKEDLEGVFLAVNTHALLCLINVQQLP